MFIYREPTYMETVLGNKILVNFVRYNINENRCMILRI